MKTVTILLSFIVNEQGIVHEAVYETQFDNCYQAEHATLSKAWVDYVDTDKADEVAIKNCEDNEEKRSIDDD